jgi:hypothetical protein
MSKFDLDNLWECSKVYKVQGVPIHKFKLQNIRIYMY